MRFIQSGLTTLYFPHGRKPERAYDELMVRFLLKYRYDTVCKACGCAMTETRNLPVKIKQDSMHYNGNTDNAYTQHKTTCDTGIKSGSLKYISLALPPIVLALLFSSNMAYARNPLYDEFCTNHDARTFGEKSTAVGECSLAAGDGATALGASSDASPTNTAVGFHAHATFDQVYEHHNENSTAVGFNSSAIRANSTAVGMESQSHGFNSTAVGQQAKAHADNSTAVGQNTLASKTGSTAIGINAKSINVNSVALGTDSVTDHDNQVSIGQKITDVATGAVSYITRTLSNLTDGTDAHDAVNKGQLDSAIAGISSGVSAEEAQKMADTAQHNAVTEAKTHTDTEINKVLNSGSSTVTDGFAIGKNALATGDASTSTGSGAVAFGDASVATGAGSEATGTSSIATGWVSQAVGDYSIATGDSAKAEGKNSVALGAYSQAKNANEVNIGIWSGETQTDTRTLSGLKDGVNPDEAVNKGQLDTAKASAISEANKYTDDEISKLDTKAKGYTDTEISKVLKSGSSTTSGSFSIGKNSDASGLNSTATGQNAQATGKNSVALGSDSVADQDNQVSIGQKITDAATGAVSYITRTLSNLTDGTDTHDAVNKGQLDDVNSKAQSYADTAKNDAITTASNHTNTEINKVLNSGSSEASGNFAIGKDAVASGQNSTATGQATQATGDYSTATGRAAKATGTASTATGHAANATKPYSTATGEGARATGESSTATGQYALATSIASTATGRVAQASGDYSTATGYRAQATGNNSIALGANSAAKKDNEVNIGIWDAPEYMATVQINTRTLSGLSDGVNSDEAVNKGQLDTAQSEAISTAKNHTDTEIEKVLNAGSSAAPDGFSIGEKSSASGMYSTATGNRAQATKTASTATGSNAQASGNYSTATGKNSVASGKGSTASGAGSVASGDGSTATGTNAQAAGTFSTALGLFTHASGKNSVALGTYSVADQDYQVSIGQKITDATTGAVKYITRTLSNLTDGTDAHDAVNKGQLGTARADAIKEAKSHTDTEINRVLDSGSSTTSGSFAVGMLAQAEGLQGSAVGMLASASGTASTATGVRAKAGGYLSTATGASANAGGYLSTATGASAAAPGKNSVALGAHSRATRDNEVNIGTWEFKPAESDKQPAPKRLNRSGEFVRGEYVQTGTRILSGVSDGVKDDEAVNRKQLNDVASTASRAAATAKKEAVRDANKYTDDTVSKANEKVLKDANTYTDDTAKKTLKTASEHAERRAVIAENNAVTRSNAYTDESSSRTLESANTYTNHRAAQAENNAVARSNAYTNKRFGELKNQVDRNEKRANGGIAGAMAMNGIPAGSGFGMAVGGYRDQGAIAIGMQKKINSDTTVSLKAAWDSGNGTGVSAGFLVDW
ncbi:hypothetical protein HYF16_003865 [Salmonella enterica]|nr:hypothetical protein [Salmonella enterica]